MEKILRYIILFLLVGELISCENQDDFQLPADDEVEVQFSIPGNYGCPFSPTLSRAGDSMRDSINDYNYNLTHTPLENLPTGSTLWLLLEKLPQLSDSAKRETFMEGAILRSFTVDENGDMMPCSVNEDGTLHERLSQPLYLKRDQWYRARVIGPARKLTSDYSMYITNNQYVYANDYRYKQTKHTIFKVDFSKQVERIPLNPVIYQIAELQFTIEAEVDTFYVDGQKKEYSAVHSLDVMPAGVVVTGLQEHYSLGEKDGEPYNWTLGYNYLIAYPGLVNNYMTIYQPTEISQDPPRLVFKGAIMPTDAVANPIIVGFYLRVNGVPTMFQMMLNRKMFLHAYYYHYKSKIKIERGVAVLEWQTVAREVEVDSLKVF